MPVYVPVVADAADPNLLAKDYEKEVQLGNVTGAAWFDMHAHNETVGTSVETVAPEMGGLVVRPEDAQVAIASTSANDTAAGTGARTVRLTYLDPSNVQKTEDFTMNGQTEVASVAADVATIQGVEVLTSGTTGNTTGGNEGTIWVGAVGSFTAGVPSAGNRYGSVEVNTGKSQLGFYRVPASKKLLLLRSSVIGSSSKETELWMYTRASGGQWHGEHQWNLSNGVIPYADVAGEVLAAGADFELRAKKSSGTGDADIHWTVKGILYDA